jgi:hypothetical protein
MVGSEDVMPRLKLDPKIKNARYEDARILARRLNIKLPKPHVYACATESGKVVVYYEPPSKPKIRIYSLYPSIDFDSELLAAKRGEPLRLRLNEPKPRAKRRASVARLEGYPEQTFGWLMERYFKEDKLWPTYADQERRKRDLRRCLSTPINPDGRLVFGLMPLRYFTAQTVSTLMWATREKVKLIDSMTGDERTIWTNAEAANSRRKWLSSVLDYAVTAGLLPVNYAKSVKKMTGDRQGRTEDGFPTWPKWLIDGYRDYHKPGSRARLVFELALYTTARKSDIPRLGRAFITKVDRNGLPTMEYTQHKGRNQKPVKVFQPVYPELQQALDHADSSGILGDDLFIVQKKVQGEPQRRYSANSIANDMQGWVDEVLDHLGRSHPPGKNGYSLHGLRKAGICMLILKGVPDRWIMAISGHRDPRMITHYGREYMREFGAEGAAEVWLNNQPLRPFREDEFVQELRVA